MIFVMETDCVLFEVWIIKNCLDKPRVQLQDSIYDWTYLNCCLRGVSGEPSLI